MTLNKIYEFSSAHRLHSPVLNEEENVKIYDKCNNLSGHGHDYRLEVSVKGTADPKTGMIISLNEFDSSVQNILHELDYKHLDKEVPFFSENLSSGEIIIQYLWQKLDKAFSGNKLYYLKLWETNNNYFECGRDV
jgi:6-pyruvoyltetrahydropterin/6-carboxytetrahydropterin synthase